MMTKRKRRYLFFLAIAFILTGCSQQFTTETEKIKVVATTTMLADLANQIGGEAVEVTCLMGSGVDPHLYQASAKDVITIQNADIVIYNGLHLEGKMGDVFEGLEKTDIISICAADGLSKDELISSEERDDIYDPHIWFDILLWEDAAKYIAEQFIQNDLENRTIYEENLKIYLKKLNELNQYAQEKVKTIPKEKRVLITAHDAFQYFGKAYGLEVMGLQGISTNTEAGTGDVSKLAGYIAEKQIPAIFIETSVSQKNIEALQAAVKAKGFSVDIGGALYSDSLGDANSDTETYIKTFRANIDTIVSALQQ